MAQNPRAPLHESFGAYVRSQRELAQLTLRQAAGLARISNPYLSQIEHGVTLPSVTVLSALADALQVSAETFLLRAAGVAPREAPEGAPATEDAIRHDPRLDEAQKKALLGVLATFTAALPAPPAPPALPGLPAPPAPTTAVTPAPRRRQPPKAPTRKKEVPHA